jgi:hypothetical protein
MIAHRGDSIRVYTAYWGTDTIMAKMMDLGFDIAGVGVGTISNITSFGLFPNPCTDGRFNVSFDAHQSISEATLALTNAMGQTVLGRTYHDVGISFFKEVDISSLANGLYFLEITVDGERLVRRLAVQ